MDWVTAIKEIQKAQEDDRLVIFVGAGVSKNSGVPSWWELIRNFGDELGYSRCDTCQKKVADCPKSDCKDRYEYTQEEFLRIPEYYFQQDASENHADYFGLIQSALHCENGPNPIDDVEMSRNVQSGNTQNLKSTVIQRSFPKWSVAERRKTAAASNQAACCACTHSRYLAGGSPSGLRV